MIRNPGKIVVFAIAAIVLVPTLLFVEFYNGFYQKFRFEQKAERYLAATYDEKMTIVGTRYLWDNIEPLAATVRPASDPSLRFGVYVNENRERGLSDDYAATLWKKQAMHETESLLMAVDPEYASHAAVDFACCKAAEYDYASIQGEVPNYGATRLPLDLTIQMERPVQGGDRALMQQSAAALRASDSLVLEKLVFLFPHPETGRHVVYEIPGEALGTADSAGIMESYNATRLPARYVAEKLGAALTWDAEKNEATFVRGDATLVVRSWGDEAILNGSPIADPIGSHIGDHMELMVPVRLMERAFGEAIPLWPS